MSFVKNFSNLELYDEYYPLFIPFGFFKLLDLNIFKDKPYVVGVSLNEYFFKINEDFYLLDKQFLKFLRVTIKKISEKFLRGYISGKIFIVSLKELEELEKLLFEDYFKAFIYCKIFGNNQLSVLIYFVANIDKISQLINVSR